MKKLFAILMSIMMIACFMPSMAFADENETSAADATLEIVPVKVGETPVTPEAQALAVNTDKGAEVKITYEVSITPATNVKLTDVKFKFVVPDGMTLATEANETTGYKLESVVNDWTATYNDSTYTLTGGDGTSKNISAKTKLMTIVATISGESAFQSGALDVVTEGEDAGKLTVKKWNNSEGNGAAVEAKPTVEATTVNLTRLIGGAAEAITVTAPGKYATPQAS